MDGHDELLRHQAFLARLTRGLVGSDHAEDLAQETWVAALRGPTPADAGALRGWLSRVARNLAIRRAERDRSRAARELDRHPGPSDEVDAAARLAIQRRVVEAVETLREPYRTAIFLRYFEGHSPAEIARQLDAPVGTVKTRLKRALQMLRERLDQEQGGREAWSLVLAGAFLEGASSTAATSLSPLSPLSHSSTNWSSAAATKSLGGTAMASKGAMATGIGVAVLGSAWLFLPEEEEGGRDVEVSVSPQEKASDSNSTASHALSGVVLAETDEPEREAVVTEDAKPAASEVAPLVTEEPPVGSKPEEEEESIPTLVGHVVHATGPPAVEATVILGDLRTTTDPRGRFALPLEVDHRSSRGGALDRDSALVAVKHGWSPALIPGFGASVLDVVERGKPVELVLPGEAGRISGFVVDANGAPAEGWRIKILDGTVIAEGDFFPLTAEEVASDPSGGYVLDRRHAEGAPPSAWRRGYHETDAGGAFEFGGLELDRTYRLRAWNASTLQILESDPIPTGSRGVVLQAPNDPPRPVVDGVVVGTDGRPLEDVRCRLTMVEHRTDFGTWMTTGQTVHTDEFGRFRFVDVHHTELFIRFNGHDGGTAVDLEPGEAYRDLVVVIERPGLFRYECEDPDRAPDRIAIEDSAGERLKIHFSPEEGETTSTRELPVEGGKSVQAKVNETAAWAVFLTDGRETGRQAIHVIPGEETLISH